MNKKISISVNGIPEDIPADIAATCRSRLVGAMSRLLEEVDVAEIRICVSATSSTPQPPLQNPSKQKATSGNRTPDELTTEERAIQYKADLPKYRFDQLIVPHDVREELLAAVDAIQVRETVFETWGLGKIEPYPRVALNFYGKPGTGKTLAAHAIAQKLGYPILATSYAQIESKFHGDGPKNVEAIFHAAARDSAVLFIDEADSLLSRRLTDVTSGSEQAINSMRSQLLICLEKFSGVVIFATNLVENYDKAFETRMRYVHFLLPDQASRAAIWQIHLPTQLPLSNNVTFFVDELATIDDICGREIKEAVIDAANRIALKARAQGQKPSEGVVSLSDIIGAVNRIKARRIDNGNKLTAEENTEVISKLKRITDASYTPHGEQL